LGGGTQKGQNPCDKRSISLVGEGKKGLRYGDMLLRPPPSGSLGTARSEDTARLCRGGGLYTEPILSVALGGDPVLFGPRRRGPCSLRRRPPKGRRGAGTRSRTGRCGNLRREGWGSQSAKATILRRDSRTLLWRGQSKPLLRTICRRGELDMRVVRWQNG